METLQPKWLYYSLIYVCDPKQQTASFHSNKHIKLKYSNFGWSGWNAILRNRVYTYRALRLKCFWGLFMNTSGKNLLQGARNNPYLNIIHTQLNAWRKPFFFSSCMFEKDSYLLASCNVCLERNLYNSDYQIWLGQN